MKKKESMSSRPENLDGSLENVYNERRNETWIAKQQSPNGKMGAFPKKGPFCKENAQAQLAVDRLTSPISGMQPTKTV